MYLVKKIQVNKSKVTINFEDGEKLEISKDIFPNFYIYEGKLLTRKEIKEIKRQNDNITLLNYALKLRQKSLYSEYKMREKLYEKGANKEQVDDIISYLKKNDLIDDKAFILDYIEYYNSLNYGKNKIISKIVEKGIFKEKLDRLSFPITTERKKAQKIFPKLEKKYEKYNDKKRKNHIYQAYLNAGFDSDIALEMIEKVKENNPRDENKKLEEEFNKIYPRYRVKYSKKELKGKLLAHLASKGYKVNAIMNLLERKHI